MHPPPPPAAGATPARRCGKGSAVGAPLPRRNFWNKQTSWGEERNLYTSRGIKKREREREQATEHTIKGRRLHKDGMRAGKKNRYI